MIPPPITTTVLRGGGAGSEVTGSTRGAIGRDSPCCIIRIMPVAAFRKSPIAEFAADRDRFGPGGFGQAADVERDRATRDDQSFHRRPASPLLPRPSRLSRVRCRDPRFPSAQTIERIGAKAGALSGPAAVAAHQRREGEQRHARVATAQNDRALARVRKKALSRLVHRCLRNLR
jgi:hypothetical protein